MTRTRKTRTDVHRPSAIVPEHYDFVACDYLGGGLEGYAFAADREIFRKHMQTTGGKFAEQTNSGSCYICGARAMYIAKFHHLPTNSYIETGMDCAEKMGIGDPMNFRSFRKRVKAGLMTARGMRKAQALLTEASLSDAWEVYARDRAGKFDMIPRQEATIIDIVGKVVRYGSISDGQKKLVADLLRQIAERPAKEAARAAEYAVAKPVPQTDERVTVQGVLLSTREQESIYGTVLKCLIRHVDGYKLWGTMPRELREGANGFAIPNGSEVEFSATVQRSDKDEKFGFFSRPTKARVVKLAPTPADGGTYSGEHLPE